MPELKKVQKWVETINTYYAFGLLLYGVGLYIASNAHSFLIVFLLTTPILAGWTGYLLKAFRDRRTLRHGFRIISDVFTYEIKSGDQFNLRYTTTIEAGTDHLVTFPIGYQWSGKGRESIPEISADRQHLLAVVEQKGQRKKIQPYKANASTEGEWHYWFVAINPPVHKGDIVEIKYAQDFSDTHHTAKPYLNYFVRSPMKHLELSVKFPPDALPASVTGSYIKPSDPSRPYPTTAVQYDPEKQWATWIITRPKQGYSYRLHW